MLHVTRRTNAIFIKTESDFEQPESPRLSDGVKTVGNDTMSSKTSNIYEATYQRFMKWCADEQIEDYTENVMLGYFFYLNTKLKMKSGTMCAYYSMLKSLLNSKHGIDIGKYFKLRAYLKKLNEHHVPKQSAAFTKEQYDKFLFEAPDEKYLAMKIVLVIGVAGACRREDLVKMKISDVEDLGSLLSIKIPDSAANEERSFTVTGEQYINIYRKYISLRPKNAGTQRLFLGYRDGKCHGAVMGKNTIGKLSRDVASYLNLPNWKEYTGHCFKKTSAVLHKARQFQL